MSRREDKAADSSARATAVTLGGTARAGDTRILAQGRGEQAEQLVRLAREHDIPVLQDAALSAALWRLPPGSRIPDSVFLALGCTLDFLLREDEELAAAADDSAPAAPGGD